MGYLMISLMTTMAAIAVTLVLDLRWTLFLREGEKVE